MSLKTAIKRFLGKEDEWVLPLAAPVYAPTPTQIPDDYTVEIVKEYDRHGVFIGSHIEPPLSSIVNATELDQLRWLAAAVNAAHPELGVEVTEGYSSTDGVRQSGYYHLSYRNAATGGDFNTCWTLINGLEMGVEFAKQYRQEQENANKP